MGKCYHCGHTTLPIYRKNLDSLEYEFVGFYCHVSHGLDVSDFPEYSSLKVTHRILKSFELDNGSALPDFQSTSSFS